VNHIGWCSVSILLYARSTYRSKARVKPGAGNILRLFKRFGSSRRNKRVVCYPSSVAVAMARKERGGPPGDIWFPFGFTL
jgi:hypothetical protein